jgi:ABC-2 type transport system ATP-binding protein
MSRPPDLDPKRLFAKTLTIRTIGPLPEPGRVFDELPAVDAWRQDGSISYTLSVAETTIAAPAEARALVAADADVLSMTESRHSLEDVYLELMDHDESRRGG